MATSLAEQLRKLATPQSSLFFDSKKRDSILFTAKEAATKDRETIFEIGFSGLEELVKLNPAFAQFESTLFDRGSKEFERAVESKEVNKKLNNVIKRFMFHLSPYFMHQSSHKCLEWLIRRFHINTFNKDEFMTLILPYHETNMFVRCVQIMKFDNPNDKWYWLHKVPQAGVPLAKKSIFEHGSKNPSFLQFIGNFTYEAIKELDTRAGTLQTMFAFYCTSVIGALEFTKNIEDAHIVNIVGIVFKGFKSTVIDFTSACYMITAQLVVRAQLSNKLLNEFIEKIPNLIHPALTINVVMLLTLIFETQSEELQVTDKALEKLLVSKWIPSALGEIKRNGASIITFYNTLISSSLRKIQQQSDKSLNYKNLCQNLINEVMLTDYEAATVIKSILNSYIFEDKKEKHTDDIITLDSDDESEIVKDESVTSWYSEFLKSLERQYPDAFDKVVKEVLKGNEVLSDKKRNALKNVLGFLLKVSCTDNNANIFENLYHHNPQLRSEAVRYLVKNFEKINISAEGSDLLKDTVTERLNDDNPEVVLQVLRFDTEKLINLIGQDLLIQKLSKILVRCMKNPSKWQDICVVALNIMTSRPVWNCKDSNKVFLALIPFMYPVKSSEVDNVKLILDSDYGKSNEFFVLCRSKLSKIDDPVKLSKIVTKLLESKKGLPSTESLLATIEEIFKYHKNINAIHIYFNLVVLAHSLEENCRVAESCKILNLIFEYLDLTKFEKQWIEENELIAYTLRQNKMPTQFFQIVLNALLKSTQFTETDMNLVEQSEETFFKLKVLSFLIEKFFEGDKNQQIISNGLIKVLLSKLCDSDEKKILFLSQFCLGHVVETDGVQINPEFQLRVLKILAHLLKGTKFSGEFSEELCMNVLITLTSDLEIVRTCGVEVLDVLIKREINENWKYFVKILLKYRDELKMDEGQISHIFFKIYADKKGRSVLEKNHLAQVLTAILDTIQKENCFDYYIAQLLNLIKYLNETKICEAVGGVALKILDGYKNSGDIYKFNDYQSAILKLIILKFNKETIKNLSSNLWTLLKKSMECHVLIRDSDGRYLTPSILVMELFEEEVFNSLHSDYQKEFLTFVVKAATFSDHPMIISAANKLFKRIEINGSFLKNELEKFFLIGELSKDPRTILQQQTEILSTEHWRCGVTLLELLQTKKKNVTNMQELIVISFNILEKCLEFQEQSRVEYTKQMVLSLIHQCCQKISPDGKSHRSLLPDSVFKIESVMKCIRETANPQTHHHALLLLCYLATMIPEQVLHSMMTIFTFIGNALVRHDDSYSFQIITKTIENVIPKLIQENVQEQVIPVLRIFSEVLLDVPEHRRIPLYVKLLTTLGEADYLWVFLGILMESQVSNHEKEKQERKKVKKAGIESDDVPRRLQIGLELTTEFDSKIIIDCCSKLIVYLKELPMTIEKTGDKINLETVEKSIFSLQTHNDFQMRHFKYITLQFIDMLLSSTQVANKIAALDQEAILALKPSYQNIILEILTFIPEMKKCLDNPKMKIHEKSYRIMLQICFDMLQSAISLLTADMLIVVVQNLVRYQYMNVRKKVLELLITKLELNYFDECDPQNVLKLLEPLQEICESIQNPNSKVIPPTATPQEIVVIQQLALVALKHLAKKLAANHVQEFKNILEILTELTDNHTNIKINVLANLVICIAEFCVELKVHSLGQLNRFMPNFLKILTVQVPDNTIIILLHSTVSSILKIVETLPQFLSPYIVKLIVQLANITPNLSLKVSTDTKLQMVLQKIQKVWNTMAQLVPSRVLIPAIDESYGKLIKKRNFKSIESVMDLMLQMFENVQDFKAHQNELSQFFLKALQFRCDQELEEDDEGVVCVFGDINESEGFVIKAFVALILKLSESSFRPLYYSVYDWAIRNSDSKERIITFYRLSNEIAQVLKSLYVLFASDVVINAATILDQVNVSKVDGDQELYFPGDIEKNMYLLEHILKTLYHIFLHDRQNFINTHRFDTLMQPIVDQLENENLLDKEDIKKMLTDCLAQLAVAASDDILWKQLNYQILLKTRNNNPEIRIFSLSACVEVARKLGEDFQPLLPETIPFLAELLEDENYNVEKSCQQAVQELEKILGEPLQKYF